MADTRKLLDRYAVLRNKNVERDARMHAVMLVRTGKANRVFQGLFPSDWPAATIANTIDIAAQDTAEMVGVFPTLQAYNDSTLDESKRSRADRLTKIINAYTFSTDLDARLFKAADYLSTYGFVTLRVEPDWTKSVPYVTVDNPTGTYLDRDRFGRLVGYARSWRRKASDLAALYPEHQAVLLKRTGWDQGDGDRMLEVVSWIESDGCTYLLVPDLPGVVLDTYEHPLGRIPVSIAERNTIDGEARGAYDDALWVWAARAKLALLSLEATQKAVEAPIALPSDVQEFALGPDSIIRSNTPERIRRVSLDLPNSSLIADRNLEAEVREAARYPEVRGGNIDASVVTGKGIQALQSSIDGRVRVLQQALGSALAESLSMSLELDELIWGNTEKELPGANNGSPYTVKYRPSRDIKGNYGVSFEYGVMAGLDPNRALVWSLQALGAGLTSKQFVRKNLPVSMNVSEEERVIDVEKLRDSLLMAVTSYAQAIPQMAATGEDPSKVVSVIADLVNARKKGTPVEDAVAKAFEPAPPPEAPVQGAMPGEPGPPGTTESPVKLDGPPPAGMSQLLAQLGGNGRADMSVRQMRQTAL